MDKIVITGGAGFIGINLAADLARRGSNRVILYDNLSRKGVEQNLKWFRAQSFPRADFIKGDIRDFSKLKRTLKDARQVFHLAAQVAVTTSVHEPIEDFEINARGALNVLEACRAVCPGALLVFASTNKVYGELLHVRLKETKSRYQMVDHSAGIGGDENLDFHSPYGCSKGTADQYFRDYQRIYGLKTVVFRQSCIYGQHQYGNEDQGWVAHFIIKALKGRKLTIYGDGKQVRDLLDVSDLVRAYRLAARNINRTQGQIYNIGGGPVNTYSLLELMAYLETILKQRVPYEFADWRPGDQKVYVSDNTKLRRELGWEPKVDKETGVRRLAAWIKENVICHSCGR